MRPEDLLARLEAGYAYDPMYGQLCNERDQLKEENSKLRELVKRFYRLVTGTDELWSWESVYAELRELGIEVN